MRNTCGGATAVAVQLLLKHEVLARLASPTHGTNPINRNERLSAHYCRRRSWLPDPTRSIVGSGAGFGAGGLSRALRRREPDRESFSRAQYRGPQRRPKKIRDSSQRCFLYAAFERICL